MFVGAAKNGLRGWGVGRAGGGAEASRGPGLLPSKGEAGGQRSGGHLPYLYPGATVFVPKKKLQKAPASLDRSFQHLPDEQQLQRSSRQT